MASQQAQAVGLNGFAVDIHSTFATTTKNDAIPGLTKRRLPEYTSASEESLTTYDVFAPLRPQPCGLPLRRRATRSEGIVRSGSQGLYVTKPSNMDSTLSLAIRGLRMGRSAGNFRYKITSMKLKRLYPRLES